MKTISLTALLLALGVQAQAEPTPYISLQAGYAFGVDVDVNDEFVESADVKEGPAYSFAVGLDYGDIRGEFEISHVNQNIDSINGLNQTLNEGGKYDSLSYMANTYYAPLYGDWEPYVGIGAGFTRYEVSLGDESARDTAFTYQGKLGFAYHLNDSWAIDTNYTYQDGEDIKVFDATLDQQQSLLRTGLRYTF